MSDKPDQAKVANALQRAKMSCSLIADAHIIAAQVSYQEGEIQWRDDVLIMIVDTLNELGCCHDERVGTRTPMMYSDWIRCVVRKRELEITRLKEDLSSRSDMVLKYFEAEERTNLYIEQLCDGKRVLLEAIDAGGMELYQCKGCGRPVVAIPDGLPMCEKCAVEAAEPATEEAK